MGLGVALWMLSIVVVLKLGTYYGVNDYSICGPWGCGPSTGTLVSIHTAWLTFLIPPMIWLTVSGSPATLQRQIGWLLILAGSLGIASVAIWQWWSWLPQAGERGMDYIAIRILYVIANSVEFPMIQLSLLGGWLIGSAPRGSSISPTHWETSRETAQKG